MILKEILNCEPGQEFQVNCNLALAGPVSLHTGVTLSGDSAQIIFRDRHASLRLVGHGPFRFRGLIFKHEAPHGGNLIHCEDATIIFEDCIFEGAEGGSEDNLSTALKVFGRSRVVMHRCQFQDNDVHFQLDGESHAEIHQSLFSQARADGLRLNGQSQLLGTELEIKNSGWSGLTAQGQATLSLRHSVVGENGCHGLEVGDHAQYYGTSNQFAQNGYNGICGFGQSTILSKTEKLLDNGLCGSDLSGQTTATFDQLDCQKNREHGFQFRENSRAVLRDCLTHYNEKTGLALFDESGADAEDLHCESNRAGGIICAESSRFTINRGNVSQNGASGLACFGRSKLVAERSRFNDCEAHGMQISDDCQAVIRDCELMENQRSGLVFAGSSRGLAESNTLAHNKVDGLVTSDRCKVTAVENLIRSNDRDGVLCLSVCAGQFLDNSVQKNGRHGVYAGPGAKPLLGDNSCQENEKEQVLLETNLARAANRAARNERETSEEMPAGVTLSMETGQSLHLPFQPKKVERTLLTALVKHGRLSEQQLGKVAKTRRVGGAMENLIDRLNRAGMPLIRHDGDGPEGQIYCFKLDTQRTRKPPSSSQKVENQEAAS